jgi:endoglucanase
MGTNLSGMQSSEVGLRFGAATLPNVHLTVPRRATVSYLAACGFTKNRLPVKWELLQPMLHDTPANAAARAVIGEPGAFHPGHESYITGVLDAHAAVGMKCIVELHNYGRYQDFRFQPDGSVIGLVKPADPLIHPYTTDNTQVQMRIFALAPGATLKPPNFTDFWVRAALKWKDHPGFGGYGLMNEPYHMPRPGEIVEAPDESEDLTIWPTFARAAIDAIRAVDPSNPIYLGGNEWSGSTTIPYRNPGWPLPGANIIYEVHVYLDAFHNGQSFDWDAEVAKNFSVGFGAGVPINLNTGADRLRVATDWAQAHGVRLAVTETGMPIDDPRWQESFERMLALARQTECEVYSWTGGDHWTLHNTGVNHVPGWHQNRTLEPAMSGPMKAAWGIAQGALFDDGEGWAPNGGSVAVTVYARGHLASPVTLQVTSSNGGTLSKSILTIPAGANGQDTFTFRPAPNTVATLTYTSATLGFASPPPPRKVYSLADPVAYAATSLPDAALAIMAKYRACKWELVDGYTDFVQGRPAADGEVVRAISDSGFGSSPGNAMEMLNGINTDSGMGTMTLPVMRVTNGRKNSDHAAPETFGFWCRKTLPVPIKQPNPRNRVPYNLDEAHFAIAAVRVPRLDNTGVVFQASNATLAQRSELSFSNSQPQARWIDADGRTVSLTSPARLQAGVPAVVSLTSQPAAQQLRVNSTVVASASSTFPAAAFDQMLLGWGFTDHVPHAGFGGNLYSAIAGKGVPTPQEMAVLERYLGTTAGI